MAVAHSDWFADLLGFREARLSPQEVRDRLCLKGDALTSTVNGQSYRVGHFSTPTLAELRAKAEDALAESPGRALTAGLRSGGRGCVVSNVLGDAAEFHRNPANRLATFQVASQFNCLEFIGPSVTPEAGVTGYINDRTQGPCCAIACGAATVYRNYLAPVHDLGGRVRQCGQSADCQIDNLRDVAAAVRASAPKGCFPNLVGGYTLAKDEQLRELNRWLATLDESQMDALAAQLRVGVQEDTQVTSFSWGRSRLRDPEQLVTQVFGSACSVAYSRNSSPALWGPLARLVLRASYEATFWAAVLAALRHEGAQGSRKVFLTALGGGVFGNPMTWIQEAIRDGLRRIEGAGLALEVYIISYAPPVEPSLKALAEQFCEVPLPAQLSAAGAAPTVRAPAPETTPPKVAAAVPRVAQGDAADTASDNKRSAAAASNEGAPRDTPEKKPRLGSPPDQAKAAAKVTAKPALTVLQMLQRGSLVK